MKIVRLTQDQYRQWRNNEEGAREGLKRSIFKRHGECQLRLPNNRILTTIKDPSRARVAGAARTPAPDHCQCQGWAGREKGRHHFACAKNAQAPEEERATEYTRIVKKAAENAEKATTPVSPDDCICQSYAGAVKGEHHQACGHRIGWGIGSEPPKPEPEPEPAIQEEPEPTKHMLRSLASGKTLREASEDEIEEARRELETNGMPIITRDSQVLEVTGLEPSPETRDTEPPAAEA